jgi:hypothetical protein
VDIAAFSQRLGTAGGVYVGSVPGFPFYQVRFPAADTPSALDRYISDLQADPAVKGATREWLLEVREAVEIPPNDQEYYNDQDYGKAIQWDLADPDARNAPWVFASFVDAWYSLYFDKDLAHLEDNRIDIGVVDYGHLQHNDLKGSTSVLDSSLWLDWNLLLIPFEDSTFDHGLSVAGVIGADANNNLGIAGGIWNVNIKRYDLATKYLFTRWGAIGALETAVRTGSRIVNFSIGKSYNTEEQFINARSGWVEFFEEEQSRDVLFVVSAPNEFEKYDLPSRLGEELSNVVTVTGADVQSAEAPVPYDEHKYEALGQEGVNVAAPWKHWTTIGDSGDFKWDAIVTIPRQSRGL